MCVGVNEREKLEREKREERKREREEKLVLKEAKVHNSYKIS